MSPRTRRSSSVIPIPPMTPPQTGESVTSFRWGWYLLSLAIPFAGILVALFLYDRDEKEVRRVGRNCLLIGFVFWILLPLMAGFMLLVIAALSMAGWIQDVMDSNG